MSFKKISNSTIASIVVMAAFFAATPSTAEWNIATQRAQERAAMEQAMREQPQGCPEGSRDLGTGGCMFPREPAYAVLASHPDASDVWVAAMYPTKESAWHAALLQCGKVMGDGCEWGWSVNGGPMGAALGADGSVHWAVGPDKKNSAEISHRNLQAL